MPRYAEQVAALASRTALVATMARQLVRDGEQLVNLHHALKLAFEERMCREYHDGDQFTEGDEERAEELLVEMYPAGEA